MGYEGRLIGEKAEIECASRLVWHSRQKIANRKWAKTDAMISAFAHYWVIIKRGWMGLIELSSFQNVEFVPVLERTQTTGNIKNRHEIVI